MKRVIERDELTAKTTSPHQADVPFVLNRKQVRETLSSFREKAGNLQPLATFLLDWAIWIAGLILTIAPASLMLKMAGSFTIFITSARLFVLGHDACHGAFSATARLNKFVGHFALLPSLTPRQSWIAGHNIAHHGYNNLRGYDYAWAPLSPDEYRSLSSFQRWKQRLYRSGWAPGIYYFFEIWIKKLFFPTRSEIGSEKPEFARDSLYVSVFLGLWIFTITVCALLTHQNPLLLLLLGFVMPFFSWNMLIGFVVYVQHTNPTVRWYSSKSDWSANQAYITGTVHVVFASPFSRLLHNVMEHTAHHVDLSIPFYRLESAQIALTAVMPDKIVMQKFGWRWYFDAARSCALYDFSNHCWVSFDQALDVVEG